MLGRIRSSICRIRSLQDFGFRVRVYWKRCPVSLRVHLHPYSKFIVQVRVHRKPCPVFLEDLHQRLHSKSLAQGELRPVVTMMGGEFDSFRELSDKNLEKLRAMAATNPNLQKSLQMYEQISGRGLSESAVKVQEENDLRWERLEADLSKKNLTMGAFSDMVLQYGFKLPKPVPVDELSKEGDFVEFMNAYASQGMDVVKDYEEKPQPHTPKCEECGKDAGMKCTQCGERYCSRECQKKAWSAHKKICKKVVASS